MNLGIQAAKLVAPNAAEAGTAPNPQREALAEAAAQFETIFTKILLDSAFKDALAGTGDSSQAGHIRALWTDQMAKQLSAGPGLGLAKVMLASFAGETTPPAATGALAFQRAGPGLVPSRATFFASPEQFLQQLGPLARSAADQLGLEPDILLAQAALETGWGRHMPGGEANPSFNLFGIKADASWSGPSVSASTEEYADGRTSSSAAEFRRYSSYEESFSDYVRFVQQQPRYQEALQHAGSAERYVGALANAGYATAPDYAERVLDVARSVARHGGDV